VSTRVAFGAVNSVKSETDCTVTFDDGDLIPCTNLSNALQGDRVGVVQIGDCWMVFGSMRREYVGELGV
jgi:hypothetical protein